MISDLITRLFGSSGGSESSTRSGDPAQASDADGPDTGVSTRLYSCADCDRTYVGKQMDECPNCATAVTQIPSEQDLDYVSAKR